MNLSQLLLAFCIIGALLSGATMVNWSPVLSAWDSFAVSTAGLLMPVWDAVGAPLARLLF